MNEKQERKTMLNLIQKILPNRRLDAGDPSPFVLWKWMAISGPAGHEHGTHEELYLLRLYIFRCSRFGIMLHWIVREDWDRDALHDHPWEFWRFIVRGGYTESVAYPSVVVQPWGQDGGKAIALSPAIHLTHRRWSFSKFPTGAYHRITEVKPKTVSFVINGPKTNSWGFFVPGKGHIPWKVYTDQNGESNGAR